MHPEIAMRVIHNKVSHFLQICAWFFLTKFYVLECTLCRWQCRVSRPEGWTCLAEDTRNKSCSLSTVTMTNLYIKQLIHSKDVSKAPHHLRILGTTGNRNPIQQPTKRLHRERSGGNEFNGPMAPSVPISSPPTHTPFLVPDHLSCCETISS